MVSQRTVRLLLLYALCKTHKSEQRISRSISKGCQRIGQIIQCILGKYTDVYGDAHQLQIVLHGIQPHCLRSEFEHQAFTRGYSSAGEQHWRHQQWAAGRIWFSWKSVALGLSFSQSYSSGHIYCDPVTRDHLRGNLRNNLKLDLRSQWGSLP